MRGTLAVIMAMLGICGDKSEPPQGPGMAAMPAEPEGRYQGDLSVSGACTTKPGTQTISGLNVMWTLRNGTLVSSGDWDCGPTKFSYSNGVLAIAAAECPARTSGHGTMLEKILQGAAHREAGWLDVAVSTSLVSVFPGSQRSPACLLSYVGRLRKVGN